MMQGRHICSLQGVKEKGHMNSRQPSLTLKYRLIFKLGRTQTFLVKISFAWITLINFFLYRKRCITLVSKQGSCVFWKCLTPTRDYCPMSPRFSSSLDPSRCAPLFCFCLVFFYQYFLAVQLHFQEKNSTEGRAWNFHGQLTVKHRILE